MFVFVFVFVNMFGQWMKNLEIAMLSAKQLMLRKDQSIIFHVQLSIKNTSDGKNYSAHNMMYPSLYHSKDLDIGIKK